jgi:hypothetical protein
MQNENFSHRVPQAVPFVSEWLIFCERLVNLLSFPISRAIMVPKNPSDWENGRVFMKKKWILVLAALVVLAAIVAVVLVTDLGGQTQTEAGSTGLEAEGSTQETDTPVSCTITLEGDTITLDGAGAAVSGTTVTITRSGTYTIQGTLDNGQILVDAEKTSEVTLVLNQADITCEDNAAIHVIQAATVTIETAEGTENTISDGETYALDAGETEPDAAIFSKGDLLFAGTGTLTVNGNCGMAIHSKDTLTFGEAGTYIITAVSDGVKGKDAVTISGGNITITAGEDGIQATNKKDADMGNVLVEGGSLTIDAGKHGIKAESALLLAGSCDVTITAQSDGLHSTGLVMLGVGEIDDYTPENDFTLTIDAQEDGIQAGTDLTIYGGNIDILTGDGSANAPEHTEEMGFAGWFDTSAASTEDDTSAKALKADGDLTVSGGTITIDSLDDALHSGGTVTVSDDADLTIATGDDGIHADDTLNITGGTIDITTSYEGLEAVFINISGGDTTLVASDDGLNAAGGSTADTDFGFMGFGGEGQSETLEEATYYIHITGGILTVDAGGDGLDSNGALFVDGGEIYVSGPTDSGNGGLDYTTTGQINGGIVVVTGASGMAQNFDTSSTQGSIMYTFSTNLEAGTAVSLADSEGNVLVETTANKRFNNVVISTPDLTVGETYTLTCGTETAEVTMDDTITTIGSTGMMGGDMGGGMGGFGGGMGGGQQPDMSDMGGGEMPDMGDGEMPDMSDAMEQFANGEMPDMGNMGDGQQPDGNGMGQMGGMGQGDGTQPSDAGGEAPQS